MNDGKRSESKMNGGVGGGSEMRGYKSVRGRGIRKGRGCILVGELEEVGRLEGKVADDGCGKGEKRTGL